MLNKDFITSVPRWQDRAGLSHYIKRGEVCRTENRAFRVEMWGWAGFVLATQSDAVSKEKLQLLIPFLQPKTPP